MREAAQTGSQLLHWPHAETLKLLKPVLQDLITSKQLTDQLRLLAL